MNLTKSSSFLLLFLTWNVASVCAYNRTILSIGGDFNRPYVSAVGREVELIYSFGVPDDFDPLLTKIRVMLRTDDETTFEFPLFATIMQTRQGTSLTLPFNIRASNLQLVTSLDAARTLCIHADQFGMDEKHFEIRIATNSPSPVFFELNVLKQDAMKIGLNVPVTINISPTTPDFFYFEFPETKKSEEIHVKVTVTSTDEKCTVLSIQPALCPVPEHAENVRVAGSQIEASTGWEWETLATKAAIVTSNKLISTSGFFIALLVTKDDKQCGHLITEQDDDITTNLTIVVELDYRVDIENFFWPFSVYFPILLNFGILLACGSVGFVIQRFCAQEIKFQRSDPWKTFDDVPLSVFGDRKSSTHSTYYARMVIILAMFYAIPVFELTTYNLTILHTTGDNDICYYNSFCAHPFGYLKDFNHLWSNMGYVIFGIGFIGITYLKKQHYENVKRKRKSEEIPEINIKLNSTEPTETIEKGIPFSTGIYYAMGAVLVMEGVMSAAYHICPNRANFQFDTCFMFMIATLCILKIFDFRHPTHLGPNGIFTILALFSVVSASGIMLQRYQYDYLFLIFKLCFIIICLCLILFCSAYTLYVGYPIAESGYEKDYCDVKLLSTKDFPHFFFIFPHIFKWKMFKLKCHRMLSVIVFCGLNICLTVTMWDSDFATLLLNFLAVNLIYYLVHYVLIKLLVHREFTLKCRSIQPLVYLVLFFLVSGVSILYFRIDLTEWRKSAAYSREGNDKCTLWDFYDEHDVWHWYSAVAIFFLYMTLLTMDDGVEDILHSELKLI